MNSLQWILMFEAWQKFRNMAKDAGFYTVELEAVEDKLMGICPIPQPKQMKV